MDLFERAARLPWMSRASSSKEWAAVYGALRLGG